MSSIRERTEKQIQSRQKEGNNNKRKTNETKS
jgi:hypothetical protein